MQATPLVDSITESTCGRAAPTIGRTEERPSTGTQEEDQEADTGPSNSMGEEPKDAEEDSTTIRVEVLEKPSIQMVSMTSIINNTKRVTIVL